jgi:hypothetical protein
MNQLEIELDRLVDGELTHEEYVRLLSRLDAESEGWRRCALAFLSAQALQNDLKGLLSEPATAVPESPAPAPAATPAPTARPPGGRSSRMWTQWGTLAASLLLTFYLGRGSVDTDPATAPVRQSNSAPSQFAGSAPRPPLPAPHQGQVTLVVENADGGSQELQLPVTNDDGNNAQRLLTQPPQLPSKVVEAFRASGHEIENRREVVPIEVESGRTILVPVDRLRVKPIRKPMF